MKNSKLEHRLEEYIFDTRNPEKNFWLGYEYEKQQQYATALSYYLRCAELSKDKDLVYECLLKAWLCIHNNGHRALFEKGNILTAIAHSPTRPEAYFILCQWFSMNRETMGFSLEEQQLSCYTYACIGLSNINNSKPFKSFDKYITYGLLYHKAYSSWYIGQVDQSKKLHKELWNNYSIDEYYKQQIENNARDLGIQLDEKTTKKHEYTLEEKLKDFPKIYAASLEESKDRHEWLKKQAKEYNLDIEIYKQPKYPLCGSKITGNIFDTLKRFGNPDYNFGDVVNKETLMPLQTWNDEHPLPTHQPPPGGMPYGCMAGHMRMIRHWLNTTNDEYAFFAEDDISFETVKYWNFTWNDFMKALPEWDVVQMLIVRGNGPISMEFGAKCVEEWSVTGYILSRKYAEGLINKYCISEDEDGFIFNVNYNDPYNTTPLLPEDIIYSPDQLYDGEFAYPYSIPLFVENVNLDSTFKNDDHEIEKKEHEGKTVFHKPAHVTSYEQVIKWWKTEGCNLEISDIMNKEK